MRQQLLLNLGLVVALASCSASDGTAPASTRDALAREVQSAPGHADASGSKPGAIASLPDRGALLQYPTSASAGGLPEGTHIPVAISEAHAFAAIYRKELVLDAPDGARSRISYTGHEDHGDGNWTWSGRDEQGRSALLTFGPNAVFASVQRADGSELRIVTRQGRTYAVVVRPDQLRGVQTSTGSDALLVPHALTQAVSRAEGAPAGTSAAADPSTAAAVSVQVDVLLGYSTGLAQRIGSPSGAETRMQNLVAIANQGYQNSGVVYRVRLVGSVQVGYEDGAENEATLHALTGSNGSASVPVDPAFNALRAAREQTGADLVSFVRQFREPDQDGCGVAWLLGAKETTIDQRSASFGYSVVSDGSDVNESDGRTYFCREETLAHELGHNMGQAHNEENADGVGRHRYSYGFREASASGFYTIMAYRISGSNQFSIRNFANPEVLFAGRATGVAGRSDNARSLNETMPAIAEFKASADVPSPPNLHFVNRMSAGASDMGFLEGFRSYSQTFAWRSALAETGSGYAWTFRVGERNGDGFQDMYVLKKLGAGNSLEVHVLSGARGFSTFLLHAATPLVTGLGNRWMLDLGDFNQDGVLDLYAIDRQGASNSTEVHVLNGADGFRSFLLHAATALHPTGNDLSWAFDVADLNRDRIPDVFAFKRNGARGLEVHVLSGSTSYGTWLMHAATPLGPTGTSGDWEFKVGDYDRDGVPDVYAIAKMGATGTEVHVLGGSGAYGAFIGHLPTSLGRTGSDARWVFDVSG